MTSMRDVVSPRTVLPVIVIALLAPATLVEAQVTGRVQFEGKAPEAVRLDMTADPSCRRLAKTAVWRPVAVDDGGLANVFVWLDDAPKQSYRPAPPVRVDVDGCSLVPRVVGAQVGRKVEVENKDPALRSVRLHVGDGVVRRLPRAGDKLTHRLNAPGIMIRVTSDVLPWAKAYVGAVPHRFFAVSGRGGQVELPTEGLPDGRYRVGLWHETLGRSTAQVEVKDGKGTFLATLREPTPPPAVRPAPPERSTERRTDAPGG